MSLSREFAAFVANLTFEDLPPEVVDRAKGVTLQALCSALVAHDMPASRDALALMQEEEAGGGGIGDDSGDRPQLAAHTRYRSDETDNMHR